VSENQLEHVIKLCNMYGKSIRCVNDQAISAYKGINIHVDYTKFNQIKKININTQKCKLEPGATFSDLNSTLSSYGFYLPYVIPGLNESADSIQVDQAVQENRLCL
jgi:FAD/FMN-containing dehydrogenase